MKRLFILFLITLFIGPSLFAGKGGADYNPDGFEISPEAYPANIPPGDEGLQAAYDADKTVLSWTHTLYGGYTLTNEFINNQYYTIAGDEYQKYVISYRIEEMKENGYVFETNATDDNLDNDPVVLAQYTVSELAGVNERIEYHLTAAHFNWDDDENIYQYKITGSIAVIHTIKLKQNRTDNIFDITRTIGVALPITDSYVFREKTPAIHNVSYDYNNEPYWDQNASQDWFGPNSSNDLGFQVKVPEDDPTYYLYNLLIYSDNPNPTPTDPPPEEPTPTITSVNKNLNYISRPTPGDGYAYVNLGYNLLDSGTNLFKPGDNYTSILALGYYKKTESSNLVLQYDPIPPSVIPEPQPPILDNINSDGDLVYSLSWTPSADDESGLGRYEWSVVKIDVINENPLITQEIPIVSPRPCPATEPFANSQVMSKLDRDTEFLLKIKAFDQVLNESESGMITFKTPPYPVEAIPDFSEAEVTRIVSPTQQPSYTLPLQLEVPGISDLDGYIVYFRDKVTHISIARMVGTDHTVVGTFNLDYNAFFDGAGGLKADWSFIDNKLVCVDAFEGRDYAHAILTYKVTTYFNIPGEFYEDKDSNTSQLPNYFPDVSLEVYNQNGTDVTTLYTFNSMSPRPSPPTDAIHVGNNTLLRFYSPTDELEKVTESGLDKGIDIEGDSIIVELRTGDHDLSKPIKAFEFEKPVTIKEINEINDDDHDFPSGINEFFVQYADYNEPINTVVVQFAYDGTGPSEPVFKLYPLSNEDNELKGILGTSDNWVILKGLSSKDPVLNGITSGLARFYLRNGTITSPVTPEDLVQYISFADSQFDLTSGTPVLDLRNIDPQGINGIMNGTLGILLDVESGVLSGAYDTGTGELAARIIWPIAQPVTAPATENYHVSAFAVDKIQNIGGVSDKLVRYDTEPPEVPTLVAFESVFTEAFESDPPAVHVTVKPDAGFDPAATLADIGNDDTVIYHFYKEYIDTLGGIPTISYAQMFADSTPITLETGNLMLDIELTAEAPEWNQSILIALWAEDMTGNITISPQVFADKSFTPANASSGLDQVNRDNDLNADNRIFFELAASEDATAERQALEVKQPDGSFVGERIAVNTDGNFTFGDDETGLLGHTEYTFRLVAFNLNPEDEGRPGTEHKFTPPNHKVVPPKDPNLMPANDAFIYFYRISFGWNAFEDFDADEILYNVYCRKQGDAQYIQLNELGIDGDSLVYNNICDEGKALLTAGKSGDIYEWYLEGYDTFAATPECVALPEEGSLTFTLDNDAPHVKLVYPIDRDYIQDESIVVEFGDNVTEHKPVLKYSDNDGKDQTADPSDFVETGAREYTYALPIPEEGEHELTVVVTDSAMNNTSASAVLKIDRTPPSTDITLNMDVVNGQYIPDLGNIEIDGLVDSYSGLKEITYGFVDQSGNTAGPERTVQISTEPGLNDPVSITVPAVEEIAADDNYRFHINLTDFAGNTTEWTSDMNMIVDLSAPRITRFITENLSPWLCSLEPVKVTVEASDPEAGIDSIQYAIVSTDRIWSTPLYDSWDDLKLSLTDGGTGNVLLLDGTYKIEVTVTSVSGLTASDRSAEFAVDMTAPEFTYTLWPSDSIAIGETIRVNLTGADTQSGISEYALAIGSAPDNTALSDAMTGSIDGWFVKNTEVGAFVLTIPLDTTPGTYYLKLRVTNQAGITADNASSEKALQIFHAERIIVSDNGQYTADKNSLTARWTYTGEKTIDHYSYEIVDDNFQIIANADAGTQTLVTHDGLDLVDGRTYRFKVTGYCTDSSTLYGESYGITLDMTAPEFYEEGEKKEYAYPAASRSDRLEVSWHSKDDQSGIVKKEALVERYDEEGNRIAVTGGWVEVFGEEALINTDVNGEALSLSTGERIYVTVRMTNGAGLMSARTSALILIDDTPPAKPFVMDAGDEASTLSQNDVWGTWKWSQEDPDSGTAKYLWTISPSRNDATLSGWIEEPENTEALFAANTAFAAMSAESLHGTTWYMAVKAVNAAGGESPIGWSDGIRFDNTAPRITKVRLLKAGFSESTPDMDYLNVENVTNDLYLAIAAHEDLLGNIGLYTAGSDEWNAVDSVWQDTGFHAEEGINEDSSPGVLSLSGFDIPAGTLLRFKGSAVNLADMEAEEYGYTSGLIYDNTVPEIPAVSIHSFISGNEIHFDWAITETAVITPISTCKVALIPLNTTVNESDFIDNKYGFYSYVHSLEDFKTGNYQLVIYVSDRAGNSCIAYSGGMNIDATAPGVYFSGTPGYDRFVSKTLTFKTQLVEDTTGIEEFQYQLGTFEDPGLLTDGWMSERVNFGAGTNLLQRILGFPGYEGPVPVTMRVLGAHLEDKQTVFLRIRAKNQQDQWAPEKKSGVITVDLTPPTTPVVVVDDYTGNPNAVGVDKSQFSSVDPESGVTLFRYLVTTGNTITPEILALLEQKVPEDMPEDMADFPDRISFVSTLVHDDQRYVVFQTMNAAHDWSEPGFSNLFTVDLVSPTVTIEGGHNSFIVNEVPFDIGYSVDEQATIVFALYTSGDALVGTTTASCPGAGDYTYIFSVPEDNYDTYRLAIQEVRDHVANLDYEDNFASLRLNEPPRINLSEMTTFPKKPFNLEAGVYDPDGDSVQSYEWQVETANGFEPLSGEITFDPETNAAFETWFEHNLITDQRTDYNVRLIATDDKGKAGSENTKVIVVNTQYGNLYTDEVWMGNHVLLGDVTVPEDLTLTIDGANVLVNNTGGASPIMLDVQGTLNVLNGSQFSLHSEADYNTWTGIFVSGTALLNGNSTISQARVGLTALPGSSVTVSGFNFTGNEIGLRVHNAFPMIDGVLFSENSIYGIKEDAGGKPAVTGCFFSGNLYDYYDDEGFVLTFAEINELLGNSNNTGN